MRSKTDTWGKLGWKGPGSLNIYLLLPAGENHSPLVGTTILKGASLAMINSGHRSNTI